jgi:hypothetical protein
MKVKLLRDARIRHTAGEIVEVSPAEGSFLLSVGSAEEIEELKAAEVPEKALKAETPEKPKKATKKK